MVLRKQHGLGFTLALVASLSMLAGLAGLAGLTGCGDDSSSSATDAGPVPVTTAQCLQAAKDQKSIAPQATIDCLCDKCLDLMSQCNDNDGCVEIRACSDKTGCRGTACYFFTPECMAIIERLGSTGLSVTLATQLNDCNDMMCMGGSDKDAGSKYDAGSKKDAGSKYDAGSTDAGSDDAGR